MLLDPEGTGAPEWDNSGWTTIAFLHEKSGNTAHPLQLLRIHDQKNLHMLRTIVQQERRPKDRSASLN